jgi:hypothetical protein
MSLMSKWRFWYFTQTGLENPTGTKSVWVRELEPYTHIIHGGLNRAAMRDQLVEFMKRRK